MKELKNLPKIVSMGLFASPAICFAAGSSAHGDVPHKHEILIQNESAFLQGKGESQLDIGYEIFRDKEIHHETIDEDVILFAYEYGLTDRLQVSLEVLHLDETEEDEEHHVHSIKGLTDIEMALSYVLFEETDSAPQVSAVLKTVLPTGDEDEGLGHGTLGLGLGVNASKMINEHFGLHFSTGFVKIDDAESHGHEVDIEEFNYGLSASYSATEDIVLLFEYKSDREKESDSDGHSESITQSYLAPGALFKFPHHREIGVSFPVGLTDESFDWGAILEFTMEF
ncbi:transporter [Puniceicoccaceae bacterium K14]|nr:transporter [Puniceicoccaceae bacterium K14]